MMNMKNKNFQQVILGLQNFWADKGCLITQPHDMEVGAGTFSPHTFLRSLGPEPWKAAYVQPSRRPADGRYGDNPFRLQHYYQFQVILKPSPENVQDLYLQSLDALGIDPAMHDIRFVEDDWESPTLGAAGLGWEVWLDGMEVTQFTYFQQVGGIELDPVCAELTYGLERISMYLQKKNSVYDILWNDSVTYGQVHRHAEREWSRFNFEAADVHALRSEFSRLEETAEILLGMDVKPAPVKGMGAEERVERIEDIRRRGYAASAAYLEEHEGKPGFDRKKLDKIHAQERQGHIMVLPAYDHVLKMSHVFNLLDARGAVSAVNRQDFIARVRRMARSCAKAWVDQRKKLGYPLLKGGKAK